MTQTLVESEIFTRPIEEALAAARAAGMLPARTTEQVGRPDPSQVQPAFGLLAALSPKAPFTAKGYVSATRPDYFQAGNTPYIAMQSKPAMHSLAQPAGLRRQLPGHRRDGQPVPAHGQPRQHRRPDGKRAVRNDRDQRRPGIPLHVPGPGQPRRRVVLVLALRPLTRAIGSSTSRQPH